MGIIAEAIQGAKQGSANRADSFRSGVMQLVRLQQETQQQQKQDAEQQASLVMADTAKQLSDVDFLRDSSIQHVGDTLAFHNKARAVLGLQPLQKDPQQLVFGRLTEAGVELARNLMVDSQKIKSKEDKAKLRSLYKYEFRRTLGSRRNEIWVDINNAMRMQESAGGAVAQPGETTPPGTISEPKALPPTQAQAEPTPGGAVTPPAGPLSQVPSANLPQQPTAAPGQSQSVLGIPQAPVVPGLGTVDDWIDQITSNYSPPFVDMPPEQQRLIVAEKKASLVHLLQDPTFPPEAVDSSVQEVADMESAFTGMPSNPTRIRAEAAAEQASTKARIAYQQWAQTYGDLALIADETGTKRLRRPGEWATQEMNFAADALFHGKAEDAKTAFGLWPAARAAYEKEHPYESRMRGLFQGAALKPDGTLKQPRELQSPWMQRVAAYLPMMDSEAALKQVYNENQDKLKGANEEDRLRISEENLAISKHAEARQTATFLAGQDEAKKPPPKRKQMLATVNADPRIAAAGPAWMVDQWATAGATYQEIAATLALLNRPPKAWVADGKKKGYFKGITPETKWAADMKTAMARLAEIYPTRAGGGDSYIEEIAVKAAAAASAGGGQ